MKLFLKGGTIVEVNLEDQVFIFNSTRFSVVKSHDDDRAWFIPETSSEISLPLSLIEKIEL